MATTRGQRVTPCCRGLARRLVDGEADHRDLHHRRPPFPRGLPGNRADSSAARAEGEPLAVTLTWTGGDPNPWDAVTYDVFMGESSDSLSMLASGIESADFSRSDLSEGSCYFWQVVARDDAGLETAACSHFDSGQCA
ncbi:MAG: hypothetical protein U5J82_15890 [Desulfobacterales bacterium]|nr:hypothetical protein [Desulfobacterales bacterium]